MNYTENSLKNCKSRLTTNWIMKTLLILHCLSWYFSILIFELKFDVKSRGVNRVNLLGLLIYSNTGHSSYEILGYKLATLILNIWIRANLSSQPRSNFLLLPITNSIFFINNFTFIKINIHTSYWYFDTKYASHLNLRD